MRIFIRVLIALALLIAAVFGLQQYAAESGEVVVLTAADDQGTPANTRLWIVDHDGSQWLRAGFEGSGWYQRLLAAETVTVSRDGTTATYVATPEPAATPEISEAMQAKYGWADTFIGKLFGGREDAIAIRLRPVQ